MSSMTILDIYALLTSSGLGTIRHLGRADQLLRRLLVFRGL